LYPKAEMPVVENVAEDQADIPAAGLASKKKEQDTMTDDTRRECRQAYLASISFMDAQVGRVLDALDRTGLADNTIIVFTSDHGYHMGEHGLWQKMSLFEESSRVPLIIVAPSVTKPNTAAKAPVAHLDLYPTLAELCGVESPKNLQGQSLVPMLKDPAVEGRGWALTQVSRNARVGTKEAGKGVREPKRFFGYTLRTPRWRYTEWDEGRQGRELYDHDADPRELTNLAEKPEHAEVVSELSEKIRTAAASSFPSSGGAPELKKEGLWYPSLTDADE
jgi:iduronate 2-sulfatase